MGYSVPHLEYVISFFGAFCLAAVGLSFPALIKICTFWKISTKREKFFLLSKNVVVMMFGFLALIIGTYTSILGVVNEMNNPKVALNQTCSQ